MIIIIIIILSYVIIIALCYQVVMKADKLLAKCFPQEALTFYNNMAAAAVRFGTSRDRAVLQGLIGMAVTLGKGLLVGGA